jgi:hypothetical protein
MHFSAQRQAAPSADRKASAALHLGICHLQIHMACAYNDAGSDRQSDRWIMRFSGLREGMSGLRKYRSPIRGLIGGKAGVANVRPIGAARAE